MFNQYASKHQDKQSKNPFTSGLNIEKPKFSKEEYGRCVKFSKASLHKFVFLFVIKKIKLIFFRPKAGSLSDLRGRKANAHILKEILELCEIISQEGTPCRDQPDVIGITFGDLFNIYTNINDKCVGLLLRARKQKFIEFEGECLFQVSAAFFLILKFNSFYFIAHLIFMIFFHTEKRRRRSDIFNQTHRGNSQRVQSTIGRNPKRNATG